MANMPQSDDEQWWVAVKILIAILRVQAEAPGCISPENLPLVLHDAANEREGEGDYGAARLLDEWARMVTQPMGDGE